MRILLIEPRNLPLKYSQKFGGELYAWEYRAIWAGYLAAMVPEHKVSFLDPNTSNEPNEIILKKIKKFNPGLIGFTTYASEGLSPYSFLFTKKISEKFKEINPDGKVVLGGYAASIYPKLIGMGSFDFLIIGDGEHTFKELVSAIENNLDFSLIKGLVYKKKNKLIFNEQRPPIKDLDLLPFPNRDIYSMSKKKNKWIPLVSGRGCPYGKCSFCGINAFYSGPHYAFRSPKNIMDEVELILEKYKNPNIRFVDEGILPRLDKILKEKNLRKLDFYFSFNARANMIVQFKKNLKIAKENGLSFVEVGIENFCENILKIYNKGIIPSQNLRALNILHEYKIPMVLDFILLSPWTKKEEIFYNLRILFNYIFHKKFRDIDTNLKPFYSFLYFYPGTDLFKYVHMKIEDENLKELIDLLRKNRLVFSSTGDKLEKLVYLNPNKYSRASKAYALALCDLIIGYLRGKRLNSLKFTYKNYLSKKFSNPVEITAVDPMNTPAIYSKSTCTLNKVNESLYFILKNIENKNLEEILSKKFNLSRKKVKSLLASFYKYYESLGILKNKKLSKDIILIEKTKKYLLLNSKDGSISGLNRKQYIIAQYLLLGLNEDEVKKQLKFEKIKYTNQDFKVVQELLSLYV